MIGKFRKRWLAPFLLSGCVTVPVADPWDPAQFTVPGAYQAPVRENAPYLFLVHAVLDFKTREAQHALTLSGVGAQKSTLDFSKAVDLMETPERIAEKSVISASVIDREHPHTWANSGFILWAPSQNVAAASNLDMKLGELFVPGTPPAKINSMLKATREKFGRIPPQELMARAVPNQYNEVVLLGRNSAGSEVKIVGIFIKSDVVSGADLIDPVRKQRLEEFSRKFHWPIVRIWQRGGDVVKKHWRKPQG
jgi:hypothetical protein